MAASVHHNNYFPHPLDPVGAMLVLFHEFIGIGSPQHPGPGSKD